MMTECVLTQRSKNLANIIAVSAFYLIPKSLAHRMRQPIWGMKVDVLIEVWDLFMN